MVSKFCRGQLSSVTGLSGASLPVCYWSLDELYSSAGGRGNVAPPPPPTGGKVEMCPNTGGNDKVCPPYRGKVEECPHTG